MGLLFGKVNVDDKDLKMIQVIVATVCKSVDRVAAGLNAIAVAVSKKQLTLK